MFRLFTTRFIALTALLACCVLAVPAAADWDINNPQDRANAKWIQTPDLGPTGLDVLATLQPIQSEVTNPQWKILADDFLCTQSGPISDIHIWGSWLNNLTPPQNPTNPNVPFGPGAIRFKLSFHDDVPALPTVPGSYSHPGTELWSRVFEPGQFKVNPQPITVANEQFYDPNVDRIIGTDNVVYQYNFAGFDQPFIQEAGKIYWLDLQAQVLNVPGTVQTVFGWKTRDPRPPTAEHPYSGHFLDDAVYADTDGFNGALIGALPWKPLDYPNAAPFNTLDLVGVSMDLSFVLTVPEPGTMVLAALGGLALAAIAWKRQRTTHA